MMTSNEKTNKALEILKQLTLEEKINLLHGAFLSGGVPRLGIPQLLCADGPLGVRVCGEVQAPDDLENQEVMGNAAMAGKQKGTAFPSTMALAATFNTDSAREYGKAVGEEALGYGVHVMFAPGVNLMRDPRNGRNFEYFGEDPCVVSELACAYIKGMQDLGVAACAKHYYANDIEKSRHYTSSNPDAVTAREIHLRPFQLTCEKAHVWTMMTGNNLVHGKHVAENSEALTIPREDWGWDGVIFTDWRAAYDSKDAMDAGLDMTTGFCDYVYGSGRLLELVKEGEVSEAAIDEKALRVLTLYQRSGVLEPEKRTKGQIGGASQLALASKVSAESMVLLKNDDNLLPLEPTTTKKLLLTGPGAKNTEAGTGSSNVNNGKEDERSITILDGLEKAYADAELVYEPNLEKAVTIAPSVDVVLYCACSVLGGESRECENIKLPDSQDSDIAKLANAAPKLAVILQCCDAVNMSSWIDSVDAVLVVWYGGQMLGEALGNVLSGTISPSGKLPCTFGKSIDDYPCSHLGEWPAKLLLDEHPPPQGLTPETRKRVHAYDADYEEGLLIGYRWFEKKNITPLFPFGFGLSYTTFKIDEFKVAVSQGTLDVSCEVRNTGTQSGAEVIQVYLAPPTGMDDRPEKELRGFAKVFLKPEESGHVKVKIPLTELAYYDASQAKWILPKAEYNILAGPSSQNIKFQSKITINENI